MKKMMTVALLTCFLFLTPAAYGAQPGTTDTVFNKRFMPNIKPAMTYEQLVKIVGTPGAKQGEAKIGLNAAIRYHWNGGKKSMLDVRVSNGKVLDATMKAPNEHTYRIDANGKVSDLGYR